MRSWLLGLCVGFALVTPLAKKVLASAYAQKADCTMNSMVSGESMPTEHESMQSGGDLSEIADPTIGG